jgi:hypothetical protein
LAGEDELAEAEAVSSPQSKDPARILVIKNVNVKSHGLLRILVSSVNMLGVNHLDSDVPVSVARSQSICYSDRLIQDREAEICPADAQQDREVPGRIHDYSRPD